MTKRLTNRIRVLELLRDIGPMTVHELAPLCDTNVRTIEEVLRRLRRDITPLYVHGWHRREETGKLTRIWAVQLQKDVPRPAPLTHAERNRRLRLKNLAIERARVRIQPASPFDGLLGR